MEEFRQHIAAQLNSYPAGPQLTKYPIQLYEYTMSFTKSSKLTPLAGRTEPAVVDIRVQRLSRKYRDGSLLNQGAKQKKQFLRLTREDKREWKEALQRAISNVKNHVAMQALRGGKLRGKSAHRFERLTKLEKQLIEAMDAQVEFQSGNVVAVAAAVAGLAAAKTAFAVGKMSNAVVASAETSNSLMHLLIEQISAFVDKVKEVGPFLWKAAVAFLIVWLLSNYAHVPILVSAVLACGVSYLPEITEALRKFAPRGLHFQSGGVSLASDLLSMCCLLWVPGKDAKSVTGEFMRRASHFPRASEGIESFMKKALEMLEGFLNFVMRRDSDTWISVTGKRDAYTEWKRSVVGMLKFMHENAVVPIDKLRECKELLTTGYGFYQVLVTVESKRDLNFWIEKLSVKLQPHQGALQAESNVRPMPYCLMFGGQSGAGKTSLLRLVASTILMLSGEVKASEALEHLWQKGTTEYWNGYVGQKCLVMDDCFQVKGKPGDMDSEAMQIIRAIGNWSYPLNFADVEGKGKFYLNTPLVVGTTNSKNIKAEWAPFITAPEALVRRFQGSFWVELTDEYKTVDGKFDFQRVNEEFRLALQRIAAAKAGGQRLDVDFVMDQMPWHVWRLKQHGFDRENIDEQDAPGGLRNAVEVAAREIRHRRESHRAQVSDLKEWTSLLGEALDNDLELQAGLSSHAIPRDVNDMDSFIEGMRAETSAEAERRMREDAERDVMMARWREFLHRNDAVSESGSENASVASEQQMLEAWEEIPPAELEHHSVLDMIRNSIRQWFADFPEISLKQFLGSIVVSGAVGFALGVFLRILIAGVSALWALLGGVFELLGLKRKPEVREDIVVMQSNEGTFIPSKAKHMEFASFNQLKPIQSQVGVPPQKFIHEHIYKNTLKCYTEEGVLGQFLGLGQDVYIFPKHFLAVIRQLSPDLVLNFVSAGHGVKGTMTCAAFLQCKIEEVPGYDVAGISFNAVFMKENRYIVQYFLAQHEMKQLFRGSNNGVRLDVANLNRRNELVQQTHTSRTCEYIGSVRNDTGQVISGLVKYDAPTIKGDCGAPLSLAENRHYGSRCLIGIHTAGRDNLTVREGYATVIPQEAANALYKALRTYKEKPIDEIEEIDVPEGIERVELQTALDKTGLTTGSFELIGVLREPVNISTSTRLKPSNMQEDQVFGPSPSKPAVLRTVERDGEVIHPMVNGLKAYQTDLECKSVVEMEPVVTVAMQKHWEATLNHSRDLLSFEDALVPPEHWRLKPFNRKTSAGYKYRGFVKPALPGKTWCLGFDGDIDFSNPNLAIVKRDVEHIISRAKESERTLHLCTDFLKDELRPLAKVESVATRVISGTEFDYSIAVRMYFGAYMAAMFSTYVDNGMAPGINHYKEWFKIAQALLRVGDNVFDGDFSRFDSSEQPWIHMAMLDYINKWYRFNNESWKEEDDRVRYILWLDLVHSRHITGVGSRLGYVVQWVKSLPSGHPLTTIVNSMYSLITLTGCYISATGESDMWKHVFLCTFGDDNVNSVSDEKRDVFNQVTVARDMKKLFGLTYTSGRKDAELVPYTTIEEVTFLKRTFVVDECGPSQLIYNTPDLGWVAPLAFESFLYEGYWYKSTRDPVEDIATRIEHCVCELALHDQEAWDEYFPRLMEWCHKTRVPFLLRSRKEVRDHVKTRFDVWF